LFIPPEEGQKIWQFFQSLLRGGLQHYYENEILCRNGERRLVAWNNTCLRDLSGTIIGVAGIGEDITERRRLENQFRQAQKMEAVGQLAGGVAHDFNNILAATMINLSLLQTNPHLDAETRETLKELELESRRASQLVRQLLQFSRKSVMRIKRLNVNEVLENLFKMLRRLIGENIRIEWNADSGLPQIEADSGMLEQVVVNLCLNARDAMPQGGDLRISTRTCEIGRSQYPAQPERLAGLYVVITVGDTGCGMDDETMQHLFEPFFTTKEIGRGTGLGLASVYGIVKQHGGWVEVESQVDKGSKFAVFLPVELAHDPEIGASISEVPPQRGTEVVLLVEDEITLRRAARQTLHLLGYEVLEANHGREALGLWQQRGGRIDLLLTDLVLPEALTGLDLAARLRSEKPGLKVIITTGYNSKSDQSGVPTDMGYLYLPKPYDVNALADMVRRCLDLKA
jgi:signal transduction histidine kinase/ActR/RegA family two-component response regulator